MGKLRGGKKLKQIREELGLTLRNVETYSQRLADKHGNPDFTLPISRLSDIENKDVVPTIFRLYSLAVVYRRELGELLGWYGVQLSAMGLDLGLSEAPNSHRVENLVSRDGAALPDKPSLDLRLTVNLGPVATPPPWLAWFRLLAPLSETRYSYGFVGTEDRAMAPILAPGSFVLIDESQQKVTSRPWRSERERPIYFVETREGFCCSWCSLTGDQLVLHPHPLSSAPVRIFRHPQQAEIAGTIVGYAVRLEQAAEGR